MERAKTMEWEIAGKTVTLYLRDEKEKDVRRSRRRRASLYVDGRGSLTSLQAEMVVPGNDSFVASLRLDPGDDDIALWLGSPLAFLSFTAEAKPIRSLIRSLIPGYDDREICFRINDKALWWSIWHPTMKWESRTPRWRNGNWAPLDTFFGRMKHSVVETLAVEEVEIPMPEGLYKGTARLLLERWQRPRAPWVSVCHRRVHIDVPDGIPFPGKGENSWDCGEDANYGTTTKADTIEEGVGHLVASILRRRRQYGGPKWRPAPQPEVHADDCRCSQCQGERGPFEESAAGAAPPEPAAG